MMSPSGKNCRLASPDDSNSEETDLEMGATCESDDEEHKDSETTLFLDKTLDDKSDKTVYGEEDVPIANSNNTNTNKRRSRRLIGWIFSGGIFPWVVNLILMIALLSGHSATSCSGASPPELTPTIAKDYISYRTEIMYDGVDKRNPTSAYQGWPSPEKDLLWDKFNAAMFRISHAEASTLPHLSLQVALPESLPKEEYLVGVTFTHAMHCLNELRRLVYPNHYPNSSLIDPDTGKVDYFRWWHTDHCVETLRRYVTCHADMTPYTFDWVEGSRIAVHPGTVHTCKNYEKIMDVGPFPAPFSLFIVEISGPDLIC